MTDNCEEESNNLFTKKMGKMLSTLFTAYYHQHTFFYLKKKKDKIIYYG